MIRRRRIEQTEYTEIIVNLSTDDGSVLLKQLDSEDARPDLILLDKEGVKALVAILQEAL